MTEEKTRATQRIRRATILSPLTEHVGLHAFLGIDSGIPVYFSKFRNRVILTGDAIWAR